MNEIFQGDNGTSLVLTIMDDEKVVDLTGSTVEVIIKYKATGIKKQATIIDAANGKCEVVLSSEDVTKEGIYSLQATVKFGDNRTFSSNVQRFVVNKKIGYVPNVGGSTGNIDDSSINGNLVVNGIEIKVYDDTQIKQDISNLVSNQHTHTNKSTLDKLTDDGSNLLFNGSVLGTGGVGGSTVSDSSTNGNIKVNDVELNVYDDAIVKTDITDLKNSKHNHNNLTVLNLLSTDGTNLLFNGAAITISNSQVLNRFGISANGRLTIDGIEQTLEDPTSPIDGGTFTTIYNTTIVDGGEF